MGNKLVVVFILCKEWQYTKMPTLFKEVQYVFKKTTKLEDIVWAAWRHAVELKAQIRN